MLVESHKNCNLIWNIKFVSGYWFPSVGGMCLLRDTLAGAGRLGEQIADCQSRAVSMECLLLV